MKLVTFTHNDTEEIGLFHNDQILSLKVDSRFPDDMIAFLDGGAELMNAAKALNENFKDRSVDQFYIYPSNSVNLLAPVPRPRSCRDAYAFRQHVEAARRNRGVEMIPEFDQFPIFYFTNHNAIIGPGRLDLNADQLLKCDHELEAAIVIGKAGRDIPAEKGDDYIAGYLIMNDFSARVLQMEEMKLNLGPAKGKDFATAIGPWLVTPDELEQYKIKTPAHQTGNKYNLTMTAVHNGKEVSRGSMADMDFTFAEIIERISYGVDIYPGEVIGSGTVGTGCYLELNGTGARLAKENGTDFTPTWLEDGDTISLFMDGLGELTNTIHKVSDYSILAKKKNT
ncbi:MAG: fumarylacetoacetate hydrolase family protein [Calditrichaeota bacterium]|nr:fumarylacetoacetate hydrolase family protein [Calditrichota bacterium]